MAYREVKPEDVPQEGGKFLKVKEVFAKIGDKFGGYFVEAGADVGQYGRDYTFLIKGEEKTISFKGILDTQLQKAKPLPGEAVVITFIGEKPPTKEGFSPMRLFTVRVDDAKTMKVRTSEPAPAPAEDDDLPF